VHEFVQRSLPADGPARHAHYPPCPKLGIKYNNLLETGIPAVGDEVEIEINAEVIKDAPGKDPPTK